jgi:fimbrial chaperone protein
MLSFLKSMLTLGVGLVLSNGAMAGTFQISPIRITLSEKTPIAVLTVRNDSAESSVMQLKVMSWSQSGNDDTYTPTDEVLANPPIFTVPAGGTQIIRVGVRRKADARRELAYRLFLQEVPVAKEAAQDSGVRVALRFGIPVFVTPTANKSPKPLLELRVMVKSPKTLRIEAVNHGDAHVQILGVALNLAAGGPMLAEYGGMHYLLPKQGRNWLVPVDQVPYLGASLKLVAHTDAGEFHANLALEP